MKKILLISIIPGNMEAIYENLIIENKHKVEIFKGYKYINNRFLGRIKKLKFIFTKYDLVIADYPTNLLSRGKKSIYMDHGSGLKIMPGKYEINDSHIMKTSKSIEKATYFITQSERERDILYSWLPYLKKENFNFLELGQPRNDRLFDENFIIKSKEYIKSKYNIPQDNEILLLAPTWRGYKCTFNNIFDFNNLNYLDEFLINNKITMIYRPHYLEEGIDSNLIKNMKSTIIIDNSMEKDAQIVLGASDYLISDYSGIIVEFLALNKPIMFLDVDYEKYKNYRGLGIDYYNSEHTPGKKIKYVKDIVNYIKDIKCKDDYFDKYRRKAIEYYYEIYDGKSTQRVCNLINKIL